jgi:hypothetical protein
MATDLELAAASFNGIITRLAQIAERAGTFIFEAQGLSAYAAASKVQLPDAVTMISGMLRAHAQSVLRGDAPAMVRQPDTIEAIAEPVPEKLTQVFSMSALEWTDHSGALRRSAKWLDVELPAEAAARALRHKKAVPTSDHRRAQLKGSGGAYPEKSWCFNCDREPIENSNAEPIIPHSGFEASAIGLSITR